MAISYFKTTKKIKFQPEGLVEIKLWSKFATALKSTGAVAQLVEHRTENPGVAGSIPARTTILTRNRENVKQPITSSPSFFNAFAGRW